MQSLNKFSGKKAFVFYEDWKKMADMLKPKHRLLFYDILTDYAFTGKLPDSLPYTLQALFTLVTPFIDRDKEKWAETLRARSEAGRRSGEARRANKTNVCSTNRTDNVDVNVNEDVDENVDEKVKEDVKENANVDVSEDVSVTPVRAAFIPPTREEVEVYIRQMGYTCSADAFYDYYAARGWMIGNHKMTDWKAAVRNWHQREPQMNVLTIKNGGNHGTNSKPDKAERAADAAAVIARLAAKEGRTCA